MRAGLMAVALAASFALAGCQDRNEWRQKLTVSLDTPAGERSGASVIRVVSRFGQLPMSGNEVSYKITGEATVVEVAPGRYLFALLGNSEAERFYRALGYNYADRGEKLKRIARMQGERRVLERKNYPLLVTFRDVDDPKTVERVDPDNLAATFGPGYRLKAITLEITDEKVTKGRVEEVLGWFAFPNIDPAINEGRKSTFRYPNESPRGYGTLTTLDFMKR